MSVNFNSQPDKSFIIAEAGRCVACGLCLPHCPTYQLAGLETESPRGRISLLSALASGELAASKKLDKLLQHCLLCRTCEKMCPSSVSFASLMDKGRILHNQMLETRSLTKIAADKLIDFSLRHPEWLRVGAHFTSPLKLLAKNGSKEKKPDNGRSLLDYLPSVKAHAKWRKKYPAVNAERQVNLFLGCVSRCLDGVTLDDTLYVLNKIGCTVIIPSQQACCGALSLHAGRGDETLKIMQQNIKAFDTSAQFPILYTATGCGASLAEYHHFLPDKQFSSRVDEICHFIDLHWPDELAFTFRKINVLLHTPCSLQNGTADAFAPGRLLGKFKNINLQETNSPFGCCGAAGTKMITECNISNRLRDPILTQIREELPDMVVTTNFGCALHITEGLRKTGLDIAVKHPVSLVADILRNAET